MAGAEPPSLRAVALDAAVPDFELVESWLAGLRDEVRKTIPSWWITRNPAHLESVLAALVRKARRGDREAATIANVWLPSMPRYLRETGEAVLGGNAGTKAFWESDLTHISLPFLADCDPSVDVTVVQVSNPVLLRAEFWRLVQKLSLTTELVQWLLKLPIEFRGVLGLCSSTEWEALKEKNALPRVFQRRGSSQTDRETMVNL